MPLVVPGVTADNLGDDQIQEWANKLVGKTISDTPSSETTFCRTELPQESRVIPPGAIVTKDYRPNRLNVHVTEDGTVTHVTKG
ncbi:hypothetical protein VTJ04DRAFT_4311 [Mycothermus thermophilus]|uniref:uncharacterized protein n=1 Tax=Humicola insolens TaxID=85995 RepID=UPI003741ECED